MAAQNSLPPPPTQSRARRTTRGSATLPQAVHSRSPARPQAGRQIPPRKWPVARCRGRVGPPTTTYSGFGLDWGFPRAYIRPACRAVWKARPKPVRTAGGTSPEAKGKAGNGSRAGISRSYRGREDGRCPIRGRCRSRRAASPPPSPPRRRQPPRQAPPRPRHAPATPPSRPLHAPQHSPRRPMTVRPRQDADETGRGAGHESSRRRDPIGHGHRSPEPRPQPCPQTRGRGDARDSRHG